MLLFGVSNWTIDKFNENGKILFIFGVFFRHFWIFCDVVRFLFRDAVRVNFQSDLKPFLSDDWFSVKKWIRLLFVAKLTQSKNKRMIFRVKIVNINVLFFRFLFCFPNSLLNCTGFLEHYNQPFWEPIVLFLDKFSLWSGF